MFFIVGTILLTTIINVSILQQYLQVLHLSGCKQLGEELFKKIGQGCPLLTEIDLKSCISVNDQCIDYLTDGCSKLNQINLSRLVVNTHTRTYHNPISLSLSLDRLS